MRIVVALAGLIGLIACTTEVQSAQSGQAEPSSFVYVRIPGDRQPVERHQSFEDPIDERLKAQSLGEVTGGGTMQSAPDAAGNRSIDYTGIDIEVDDLDTGRSLLREMLPDLGAPTGTQIEFTVEDQHLQDRLTESGWVLDERRTDRHPGFDI